MKHTLKTWPEPFKAVWDGIKKYEIRHNDRFFEEGDTLVLCEYYPEAKTYSGREIECLITYISEGTWGLPAELCVMSLQITKKTHTFTDS